MENLALKKQKTGSGFNHESETPEKIKGTKHMPLMKDIRTRFSDHELKEFKVLILKKLDEAKMNYELLRNVLSLRDDNGTNDTSPTFKLMEDAADVLSKEETAQLAIRQEKIIQRLQNALIRIENKTYGQCSVTGKLIPKERLRSIPHATMSINAQRDLPGFNK